jgi:hypothetical protein
MIAAADSSNYHPTLAQLQAAYAQGVRVWGFYLPGPGIYSGNTKADFDRAHQAQMKTIGWASGNADPGQQKALAASWAVDYPTLDDEGGIRAYGSWEQPWLDTSGFGLYMPYGADGSRIKGFRAPWYIMADYLGRDPQATWNGSPPPVPHGWQWAGTVNAYGGSVDRLWLDDWFGSTPAPAQGEPLMKLISCDALPDAGIFITDGLYKRHIGALHPDLDEWLGICGQSATIKISPSTLQALWDEPVAGAAAGASGPLSITLTGTAKP